MPSSLRYSLPKLHARDGGRCWLCREPCELDEATRDHVIPHSLGGAYSWKNFALAHEVCNKARADAFPVAEFMDIGVPEQRQAWERSEHCCERCERTRSLVLYRHRRPAAGWPRVQVLCVVCTDHLRHQVVPQTSLTNRTVFALYGPKWDQLRASALARPVPVVSLKVLTVTVAAMEPVTALAATVAVEPEPVVAYCQAPPVEPLVAPVRPTPRFTPADMARQLAAAKAREQARQEVLAAERAQAEACRLAELAAHRPSWIRRAGQRVACWWRALRRSDQPPPAPDEPVRRLRRRYILTGPVLPQAGVRGLIAAQIKVDSEALHGLRRYLRDEGVDVAEHRQLWAPMLDHDLRTGVLEFSGSGQVWMVRGEQIRWVVRADGRRLLGTRSMEHVLVAERRAGRVDEP